MKTRETFFCATPFDGDSAHLFAVREGISVELAIEEAGARLGAGLDAMRSQLVGMDQTSTPLWSAYYNFEAVFALLDAVVLAVGDHDATLNLDLTEAEAALLAQIAEREGSDPDATAASLLSAAIRQHAAAVAGGAA